MATQAKPDLTSAAPAHGARHVAIIMDGNGRWAKKRLLPRIAGHRAGVEAVRRVARAAQDMGLENVSHITDGFSGWKAAGGPVGEYPLIDFTNHYN